MYMNDFATEAQLRVLLQHTGIDYSNDGITKKQASILIRKSINENKTKTVITKVVVKVPAKDNSKGLEKEFIEFMKGKIDKFVDTFNEEVLDVKAVIGNDTKYVKDDGKRYVMLGFGCAFVYLNYDKRSKLGQKIAEIAGKSKNKDYICNLVMKALGKETIKYLEKIGNPFEALWFQNLSLKMAYYHFACEFAKIKGVKNMTTNYHMD